MQCYVRNRPQPSPRLITPCRTHNSVRNKGRRTSHVQVGMRWGGMGGRGDEGGVEGVGGGVSGEGCVEEGVRVLRRVSGGVRDVVRGGVITTTTILLLPPITLPLSHLPRHRSEVEIIYYNSHTTHTLILYCTYTTPILYSYTNCFTCRGTAPRSRLGSASASSSHLGAAVGALSTSTPGRGEVRVLEGETVSIITLQRLTE